MIDLLQSNYVILSKMDRYLFAACEIIITINETLSECAQSVPLIILDAILFVCRFS